MIRRVQVVLHVLWLMPLGLGCAHVNVSDQRCQKNVTRAVCHYPRIHIPHGVKCSPAFWWGNLDDPFPPEWYRPDDPRRDRKWYFRNPLHNFDFYVIGIADREFVRVGRHPAEVFNPNQGWNWAVCKRGWIRLPFVSWVRADFKFYCGWRERGNFGFKLSF